MPSVPGTSFPQTGSNRTVEELVTEIAEHEGGASLGDVRTVAFHALRDAVRQFNSNAWKFNRREQTITLVADTSEYDLNTNFRSPLRAVHVDSNDKEVFPLPWIPFEEKLYFRPNQQSTTNTPEGYTAFDVHGRGKVLYFPPLGSTPFNYPKIKHYYHSRIALPGYGSKLDVPIEVEDAIYQLAIAKFIAKARSFKEGKAARDLADEARFEIESRYRDWGDIY